MSTTKAKTLQPPEHIAIIMDGNGRWAKERGRPRTWGHREGAKRVDDIVTECTRLGVKYLTLYAFSTENWKRPSTEVSVLMRLLVHHLKTMDKKLLKNKVSLQAKGSLDDLPAFARKELNRVIKSTALDNPVMTLTLCLSYGGRREISDAVKKIASEVKAGNLSPDEITEETISKSLYQPEVPDPDLLIRTAGEFRVSNFLLWEIAYTEFYITETLWPDFREDALAEAIDSFHHRERRFGMTSAQRNLIAKKKSSTELSQ